ncbi:TCDD-inducible poly [ADP-ribose] polymerase [Symbiodinium microadriaticum]|uniref:TCDD-inducible poly [ADP-ribose] polymerase n=1 Tax=Symbiodinium microadriaticum TaxID=2951 RepID=A0A1Q9F6U1_SYMMI|nr:TCDD-inducible poly [ADP-ribose] polymerase [Symbiodinium microadriaticum]CAE7525340.1 tank-1 [Symbiodinium microadriaticum]
MGSGAAKVSSRGQHHHHRHEEEMSPLEAAKHGDKYAQEFYMDILDEYSKDGNVEGVEKISDAWSGFRKLRGVSEAAVIAARYGQHEVLEAMVKEKFRLRVDKNDREINPLMMAIRKRDWHCIEPLIPLALDNGFAKGLLQDGMEQLVLDGDTDTLTDLATNYHVPGNSKLLCRAALLKEKAKDVFDLLAASMKGESFSRVSTVEAMEDNPGWEDSAPIHIACQVEEAEKAKAFVEFLMGKKVDVSKWGKTLSKKLKHSKRLPLHYAAENKNLESETVKMVAEAYPAALFEPVGGKAGRKLPVKCASHSEKTGRMLEELMYQHVCDVCDQVSTVKIADVLNLMRLATEFEKIRTISPRELDRGRATDMVSRAFDKVIRHLKDQSKSVERQFVEEAISFAEANPRVDLGRETSTKVEVQSISKMGEVLKSDFWELLKLVNSGKEGDEETAKAVDDLIKVPELEELLTKEIASRLKWAAAACDSGEDSVTDKLKTSDAVRYALFVLAGLISISKKRISSENKGDDSEDDARPEAAASLATTALETSGEDLEKVAAWYCKELQLPEAWNVIGLLREGLAGGGLTDILFSGGDLVIKKEVPKDHAWFQWAEGLFDATFLHIYTRDRHGENVPEALRVKDMQQVFNCGSWGEYARRRQSVQEDLFNKGAAWLEELKTDPCTKGEIPRWHLSGEKSVANEHWLYHGTSLAGEEGITEGDFRLNLAGSNAGTLYGNGVYLAEAVSKSDEYTTPHSDGLRSILICLSTLGRVNYNDQKRPDGDELADSCKEGGFHSILGDREKIRGTYREIVVFNENQVYPAYICRYERVLKKESE